MELALVLLKKEFNGPRSHKGWETLLYNVINNNINTKIFKEVSDEHRDLSNSFYFAYKWLHSQFWSNLYLIRRSFLWNWKHVPLRTPVFILSLYSWLQPDVRRKLYKLWLCQWTKRLLTFLLPYLFTYILNYLLTHLLTYLITFLLTYSLTYSLTY